MGASMLSSQSHLIHNLLRSAPSSFSTLFSKPSLTSAADAVAVGRSISCCFESRSYRSIFFTSHFPYMCRRRAFAHSASVSLSNSFSSSVSFSSKAEFADDEEDGSDSEDEPEIGDVEVGETVGDESETGVASELSSSPVSRSEVKLPSLTVKEKKELASYAHSLGKKLKTQLVGKSGVTPNLATSFVETLEANELLKIKIHRTCPGELEDAVRQLERLTGSVVVGQIGRTIIIYRPSITKMKAEEKRRQARRIFVRKEPDRVKSILQNKLQISRISNRGRRGSSKV